MKRLLTIIVTMTAVMSAHAQKSSSNVGLGVISINDSVKGVQLSPISNIAEHSSGVQLAVFSNVGYNGMEGVQLSALNNIAIGGAKGVQLSGFTNQTFGTMRGLQLAFRNQTDTLRGVQLGLFNFIAQDYRSGVQIGFVNFSRDSITKRFGL